MMARRTSLRALAMLIGLALLAALSAVPAQAIETYPGETQEAFAARAEAEQQRKLAEADAAAGGPFKGMAGQGRDSGTAGSALKFGAISLVMLILGGLRMSRGILGASRSIAKASGAARSSESFEDRLAEKLRELERSDAIPTAPMPPAQSATAAPARPIVVGPRTFGKRVS